MTVVLSLLHEATFLSTLSLRVFYKTLAVGKDTYEIPLNKKNKINKASYI